MPSYPIPPMGIVDRGISFLDFLDGSFRKLIKVNHVHIEDGEEKAVGRDTIGDLPNPLCTARPKYGSGLYG